MQEREEKRVERREEEVKVYTPPETVKFEKKERALARIPTASLPDIVFMLLLFFMVSTVFKEYQGLKVDLPAAHKIEKLPGKRTTTYIWIDRDERISIDDKLVRIPQIARIMYQKRVEIPQIIVSLKIDRNVNMGIVTDVHQQLREADALRINYSTKYAAE